jgi:glyoxylase-like metal-dependent hydrolase (beta-lactamase superfamily II)
MKLFKIETGNFMCDGGAIFGVVPKVMWQKKYPCDEDNYCNLSMRCLLIDTGDRKVLIDTGVGNKQSEKFLSYYRLNGHDTLLRSLNDLGYKPENITDVVLTHLHFDHCGGCTVQDENGELQLVFSNATHWVSKQQWENYNHPNLREGVVYFPENMQPVEKAGRLRLIDQDGEWIPGIDFRLFHGHTPGNIVPIIHYGEQKIAFMGDLLPVVASLALAWVAAYDVDPIRSIAEKREFLDEALQNDTILFFEHDLHIECCNLMRKEEGVRIKNAFSLSDLTAMVEKEDNC